MTIPVTKDLMTALCRLAREAGGETLKVYASHFAIERKDDRSPVTEADTLSEAVILNGLKNESLGLGFPVISEEAFADGQSPDTGDGPFWLVDPLDGTRDFIDRNDQFSVCIALVTKEAPILGVIYAPALDALYWGSTLGTFASLDGGVPKPIKCRKPPSDGMTAMVSRHHNHPDAMEYLAHLSVKTEKPAGSAYKFCLLAAGEADIYPRFGRTMEWDTAAGHAILDAAGGSVTMLDGTPFVYGKEGFANPGFVARGSFPFPQIDKKE